MVPKSFTLPFIEKKQVSRDAYAFYFDRTKEQFDFVPGNFIRITLPHENPDERGIRRFFSIITSPLEKDRIGITTRIIQSSFKHALANLSRGTPVDFFGPSGNFLLREEEMQPHILLAGGIGVTPYHSMLIYAKEKKLPIKMTLFASFPTVADILFQNDFAMAAKENPLINVIYTITQEDSQGDWKGEKGRISAEMIKRHAPDFLQSLVYIVGPQKMVEAMEEVVKEMGVTQEQIRKENFTGY